MQLGKSYTFEENRMCAEMLRLRLTRQRGRRIHASCSQAWVVARLAIRLISFPSAPFELKPTSTNRSADSRLLL